MYTPIHQNNPATEDISLLKEVLAEKGLGELYERLYNAQRKQDEEIENIHRLFRIGDDDGGGGGGGGGGFGLPPKPKHDVQKAREIILPPIDFYTTKLIYPDHPVMSTLPWGRRNKRFFIPVMSDMNLLEINGVIWVESNETTRNSRNEETRQIYIKMLPLTGNPKVTKGNLLGFEVGFRRFDVYRGYMFLDIYEYPEENTNVEGADLTWEIPLNSRKFMGTEKVLTENLVEQYGGGAGMKLDMYLTIKATLDV